MSSPVSSFTFFVLALLVGGALTFLHVSPYWEIAPVIWYAFLLKFSDSPGKTGLDGHLRDSPYFLGFILTMFGLFRVFRMLGSEHADGTSLAPGAITAAAGAAILPTVAGLIMRQLLWARRSLDVNQLATLQQMTESLQTNAAAFHQRQKDLVQMIGEFADDRKTILEREKKASEDYVKALENGGRAIGKLLEQIPTWEESIPNAVSAATAKVTTAGDQFKGDYERETAAFVKEIGDARKPYLEALKAASRLALTVGRLQNTLSQAHEGLTNLGSAGTGLSQTLKDQTSAVQGEIKRRATVINDDLGSIEQALNAYVQLVRKRLDPK